MFTVGKIAPDVKRVLGHCDDDTIINRVNAAVEILTAELDVDPTVGYVDICVDSNRCVALPDEVEQVLAVNISGRPSQTHDKYWDFNLNGPGLDCNEQSTFDWVDKMAFATRTDPTAGFEVVAYLDSAADNNAAVRVYGYDTANRWIVSTEGGETVDGFLVPTVYGTPMPNPDAPLLARITRVSKAVTKGFVRLQTLDGTVLGDYRPYETEPQYRRIRLSKKCTWARIMFKKKFFELRTMSDLIPLHSPRAVVLMVQALKKFDEDRLKDGQEYRTMAIDLLKKKQHSVNPPAGPSIQFADRNLICDKTDRMDP